MKTRDTNTISRIYFEQIAQSNQSTAQPVSQVSAAKPPVLAAAKQQGDPGQQLNQGLGPNTSVENYVSFLQNNQDPRVRAVILAGLKDGNKTDEVINVQENVPVPVSNLMPTQNEIGIDQSILNILNNKEKYNSLPDILTGKNVRLGQPGDDKILAYSNGGEKMFVLDGHHRWSTTFVGNPKATVVCDILKGDLPAAQILKAVHSAIYADVGATQTKPAEGKNLLSPGDYDWQEHLNSVKQNLDDEYRAVWGKIQGYDGSLLDSDEKIAKYTWENIELMRKNGVAEGAPKRDWMPQPGLNNADQYQSLLKKGIINFKQPRTADTQGNEQSSATQPIAASYEYKGDLDLLWEMYQRIVHR